MLKSVRGFLSILILCFVSTGCAQNAIVTEPDRISDGKSSEKSQIGSKAENPVKKPNTTPSAGVSNPKSSESGIPYYLPVGRIGLDLVEYSIEKGGKKEIIDYRIEIKESNFDPDPNHRHLLKFNASIMSSDHLCVTRTSSGLLKSIQFVSSDQTDDILVRLAETAVTASLLVAGVPTGPAPLGAFLKAIPAEAKPTTIYSAVIDPLEEQEIRAFSNAVAALTKDNLQNVAAKQKAPPSIMGFLASKDAVQINVTRGDELKRFRKSAECNTNGVCFRTKVKIPVALTFYGMPHVQKVVELPDYRFIGTVNIERAGMVHKTTKVGFDNGFLQSFNVNKPSEGVAAATLPLRIMSAILDVPAGFFNKIAAGFQSQTAATEAETKLILAEAEKEKAEAQKLESASKFAEAAGESTSIISDISAKEAFDSKITCVKVDGES